MLRRQKWILIHILLSAYLVFLFLASHTLNGQGHTSPLLSNESVSIRYICNKRGGGGEFYVGGREFYLIFPTVSLLIHSSTSSQ